jgi:hypothetical protein
MEQSTTQRIVFVRRAFLGCRMGTGNQNKVTKLKSTGTDKYSTYNTIVIKAFRNLLLLLYLALTIHNFLPKYFIISK